MRIATGALRPHNDTVFYMGCGAGGRQAGASALTHCLPIEFVGGGVLAAPLTGGLYSTPPGTAAQSRGVLFLSFVQWSLRQQAVSILVYLFNTLKCSAQ